jgi:hypothetical protein
MKNLLIAAAALAGALAASPASAALTVLDFSGDACVTDPCGTGSAISQSYGDGLGVDVSYEVRIFTGLPSDEPLKYGSTGYGDLSGVVWGGLNQTDYFSRITFTALPGYEISLRSFDIATVDGLSPQSPVLVESLGGTGIFADDVDTLFPGHNAVAVNSSYFTDGIVLNWGPDGFNVGLDNIAFDVRAIGGGPGVPEPATWAMMILGLGAAGSVIRRRQAALAGRSGR